MFLSIVVPVYNEGRIIAASLSTLNTFFSSLGKEYEIIVVDDGSTDTTAQEVATCIQHHSTITVYTHTHNRGKGAALKTGVAQAQGEWILLTDTDLATPLTTINPLLRILPEWDIIIGSRAIETSHILVHQAWYKELLGRAGNLLIRTVLKLQIHDTQCGFKLFRRTATLPLFQVQKLQRWSFDFEILFLAHHAGLRILEVPVTWSDDGDSRVKLIDYIGTLFDLVRIRWYAKTGAYRSILDGK